MSINNCILYTVEKGETVLSIAQKNYGRAEDKHYIYEANNLPNNKVYPGMKIWLPMGKDIYADIFGKH